MKTTTLAITFLMLFSSALFSQSGIKIRTGGQVTVNGNLIISPCDIEASTAGVNVPSATQIIWNWNAVSTAAGYKWNTINDYGTATDLGTATSKTEAGLTCNTAYTRYVWAYRACGSSAVLVLNQSTSACPWTCGSSLTDTRDGKVYTTVQIGTQCWMVQNMNLGTLVNSHTEQTNNNIAEKYCWDELESNCSIYGGLYEWAEVVQYLNGATNTSSWNPVPTGNVQGICPSGWHIPKEAEWTIMSSFLGGDAIAGGKMKEAGTTHWITPNTGATNSSGFTGLPGGFRENRYGGTYGINRYADFWLADEYYYNTAWQASLDYNSTLLVHQGNYPKEYGVSVRCLKD